MPTPDIYNTANLISNNIGSSMQSSSNRIRTKDEVDVESYGWRQLGMFFSAGGTSRSLSSAVIGSGGTVVGA